MLNDEQHKELRRLLKIAIMSGDRRESEFALEDCAKIVGGIESDDGFNGPHYLKAGKKKIRVSDEELNDAYQPNNQRNFPKAVA